MQHRLKHHYDSAPVNDLPDQPVPGLDQEFHSIEDYILRITYRIWEGKQIGLCLDYYSDDCPVYTLAGCAMGSEQVMQGTMKTLASFPDRTLHAENLVCAGDEESGYHSSHLILTSMTNLGDSEFGPATGKSAQIRVIAHCIIKDNKIVEEWLVRDNYALVEQLGFEPDEVAKQWASAPQDKQGMSYLWQQDEITRVNQDVNRNRVENQFDPVADSQNYIKTHLHNIWNARMLGDARLLYADNAVFHGVAGRQFTGIEPIQGYYLEMMGAFSDAKMSLDYSCETSNKLGGKDIAVRWTMAATHSGHVRFGAPTSAPVLLIGESQYRTDQTGKVVEEWTIFDELSLRAQIWRARQASEAE